MTHAIRTVSFHVGWADGMADQGGDVDHDQMLATWRCDDFHFLRALGPRPSQQQHMRRHDCALRFYPHAPLCGVSIAPE